MSKEEQVSSEKSNPKAGNKSVIYKKHVIKPSDSVNWNTDVYRSAILQRNLSIGACIIVMVALISALLLIRSMFEKNSIEPYVVTVSERDKIPIAVNLESVRTYSNVNQAIIDYFVLYYIKSRESYNYATHEYDYDFVVKKMSSKPVFHEFFKIIVANKETSPIYKLGDGGTIEVIIKQITIEPKYSTAMVRIAKKTTPRSSVPVISNHRIKLHYIFDTANLKYEDLMVNPLGMRIDSYEIFDEKTFVEDEVQNSNN